MQLPYTYVNVGYHRDSDLVHIRSEFDGHPSLYTLRFANVGITVSHAQVPEFCARVREILDRMEASAADTKSDAAHRTMRQGFGT